MHHRCLQVYEGDHRVAVGKDVNDIEGFECREPAELLEVAGNLGLASKHPANRVVGGKRVNPINVVCDGVHERLEVASREGLVAAEENYRVRRELYRAGKATIVEVTDAETDLTRARLDVVNSHVDVRIARVALSHALGRDVTPE